jgi:hypothetical protein
VVGDFNARIHNSAGGEHDVFGDYCFGDAHYKPQDHPNSNRELVLELCVAKDLCVANTLLENDSEHLVTCHDIWQNPVAEITQHGFAQLDLVLCPRPHLCRVKQVRSDRWQALASHHFLLEVVVHVSVDQHDNIARENKPREQRCDLAALSDPGQADKFAQCFARLCTSCPGPRLPDEFAAHVCEALHQAGVEVLPARQAKPARPWIRGATLALIDERNAARRDKNHQLEGALNKQIKKSARVDRASWADTVLAGGSWMEVQRFRKLQKPRIESRRLQAADGRLVESSERSETFARHLETVQWAVRPMSSIGDRPPLGQIIPTCSTPITPEEVQAAVRKLKVNRAAVQIPAEYLKALLNAKAIDSTSWVVRLFQLCWDMKATPTAWHVAKVIPVYKKGDPAECDNYRPISLVSVLYKLYASILLHRLKAAGAERRLWDRQFGFRSKRSTEDALFIVRRRMEQAIAAKGGRSLVLALDWRKAFDSICPERLSWALQRFGLNESMLAAINDIYTKRTFVVVDSGTESAEHPQHAGISQGCPLSPFLFGIVMTVLMHDAKGMLSEGAKLACQRSELEDVLFADDTLLIGSHGPHIEEYMAAVERAGLEYGLQIHWGKVGLVAIGRHAPVHAPAGEEIKMQDSMVYLGSTIHKDGKFASEISRKIGAAHARFRSLQPIWQSRSIAKRRKLELFDSFIFSKLKYGVASAWLSAADLRRLDGFQAACLRKLLKVPPPYISRVSNERIRTMAGQTPLSEQIRHSQLALLKAVLNDPSKSVLRDVAFAKKSDLPLTAIFVRKVGRPRHNWTDQVLALSRSEPH